MGLWTKSQREASKKWVTENAEMLVTLYQEGHSVLHLQQLAPIKVGRDLIENCIQQSGIPLRGISQNGKAEQLEKARQTSKARFGYENASSSPTIKAKRARTFLERFGVENPFQHAEIQRQIRESNIEKYGHPYPGTHSLRRMKISVPHRILSEALFTSGIQHKNEVVVYNKNICSKYKAPRADILIGDKLIVEVFGDYYHANPAKYKATDLISRFRGKVEAQQIWQEDAAHVEKLRLAGYTVLVVWEQTIKKDIQKVLEEINAALENLQDRKT